MRALFLDRDGVICAARRDYVKSLDEFEMLPGAAGALRRARGAGLSLVVVTNQSGIGRGLYTSEACDDVNSRMAEILAGDGAELSAIYVCPHTPDDGCECRKPKGGMLLSAAEELGINLADSYLVGDSLRDLQAAASVGVSPVLVLTGFGEEQLMAAQEVPGLDYVVVADLSAAVDAILEIVGR